MFACEGRCSALEVFGLHATMDKVIKNGEWVWPSANSDQLVEIQSKLLLVIRSREDGPKWGLFPKTGFSPLLRLGNKSRRS